MSIFNIYKNWKKQALEICHVLQRRALWEIRVPPIQYKEGCFIVIRSSASNLGWLLLWRRLSCSALSDSAAQPPQHGQFPFSCQLGKFLKEHASNSLAVLFTKENLESLLCNLRWRLHWPRQCWWLYHLQRFHLLYWPPEDEIKSDAEIFIGT